MVGGWMSRWMVGWMYGCMDRWICRYVTLDSYSWGSWADKHPKHFQLAPFPVWVCSASRRSKQANFGFDQIKQAAKQWHLELRDNEPDLSCHFPTHREKWSCQRMTNNFSDKRIPCCSTMLEYVLPQDPQLVSRHGLAAKDTQNRNFESSLCWSTRGMTYTPISSIAVYINSVTMGSAEAYL